MAELDNYLVFAIVFLIFALFLVRWLKELIKETEEKEIKASRNLLESLMVYVGGIACFFFSYAFYYGTVNGSFTGFEKFFSIIIAIAYLVAGLLFLYFNFKLDSKQTTTKP